MSKLDEAISNTPYILDSLMALRNIQESGSCNDCGIAWACQMKPQPGQMVRYNCPFWVKQEGEE